MDVVLVDTWPGGGRLTWQVRADDVTSVPYSSRDQAARHIARALGLSIGLVRAHDYTRRGPDTGYLLAWSYRPIRRLGLPRPADMRFRPNGWLRVDDQRTLTRWGVDESPSIVLPKRPRLSPIGQGRLGVAERLAVEDHAMRLAADWCRTHGWSIVDDVSRQQSWDLEVRKRRDGRTLFVEVKGTTGSTLDVEVTAAEVRHARANARDTVLIIVTDIRLKRGTRPMASGGTLHAIEQWSPADGDLLPTRYRWRPSC